MVTCMGSRGHFWEHAGSVCVGGGIMIPILHKG